MGPPFKDTPIIFNIQAYVKRIQYILWHHILIHFPLLQKTISVFTGTYKTLPQRNCRRKVKDKRDLLRRVSTNEEAESAVSKGLIPILLPYELSEQFSSIPPFAEP